MKTDAHGTVFNKVAVKCYKILHNHSWAMKLAPALSHGKKVILTTYTRNIDYLIDLCSGHCEHDNQVIILSGKDYHRIDHKFCTILPIENNHSKMAIVGNDKVYEGSMNAVRATLPDNVIAVESREYNRFRLQDLLYSFPVLQNFLKELYEKQCGSPHHADFEAKDLNLDRGPLFGEKSQAAILDIQKMLCDIDLQL
jgi:hypothetical protein